MLPESLLCLLSATLAFAQARQQLKLDSIASFNTLRINPPSFSIPQQERLSVSIALCSVSSSQSRFFVSNISNSDTQSDPGPAGGTNVFEIKLADGLGSWTGRFPNGGLLSVQSNDPDGFSFDVGLSSNGDPLHQNISLPFLGDTTSNQAIVLSAPFATFDIVKPSYPNYTLPSANMSQPPPPPSTPNMTLIVTQTSLGIAGGPRTGCFLSSQTSAGAVDEQTIWARDKLGYRTQWLLSGLTPSTNYTAFVIQDNTKVSGPIYFATKSAAFVCPLVHSLPFCPGVAYSMPLPAPPSGSTTYTAANLPSTLTDPLLSYIANFTVVLTTLACGRDWYSPLKGCDDCQREYRRWLCAVSLPRCSEPSPANPDGFTSLPAEPSATGIVASKAQQVLSALVPVATRDARRNEFMPALGAPYTALLPCLEQCNIMDRACPPFIGIKCPTNNFNAGASYGVGYIDSADGDEFGGLTGAAQDRWGNVWCQLV